jgi:two-component system sensor histidine kinase KdpD
VKSALLSSVSHDLRSPLTAIKTSVGALRDERAVTTPEDSATLLATIEAQTDRLTATVANLLAMTRLEAGAVRPQLEAIEALPLLEEAALAAAPSTAGRYVSVHAPEDLWVRADYGLLMQALANLLDNAAKYSIPEGPICLTACRSPAGVAITVADSGPGIPATDLPHVFEKFYRGSCAPGPGGTGLGLAIVRALVELCGGSIAISSLSAGALATVSLPRAVPPR